MIWRTRSRLATPRSLGWLGRLSVVGLIVAGLTVNSGCDRSANFGRAIQPDALGIYHVRPGDNIQAALDAAAKDAQHKTVHVHTGTYRPDAPAQALVRFNRQHDGITLEADGAVTLTAANESVASRTDQAFPALVNHVLFFGDGISPRTIVRGFTITGANGFAGNDRTLPPIEPDSTHRQLQKGMFFYLDGGGVKIFGRSYPTLENLEIRDNWTLLCGGGVSIEHRGFADQSVVLRDCVFRNNHCPATGSAIDVLEGSSATIENCLFVGNIGNTGMDQIRLEYGLEYNSQHGCGALTVFPKSRVVVRRCTFTGNWNGVDDHGRGSVYSDSIFWNNDVAGKPPRPQGPYEIDIEDGSQVRGCWFGKSPPELRQSVDISLNQFDAPDPKFDAAFEPRAAEYHSVGYRTPAPDL